MGTEKETISRGGSQEENVLRKATPPSHQDHVEEEVEMDIEKNAEPKVRTRARVVGLPHMDSGVVQHVLDFLCGLEGTGATSTVQATQDPVTCPATTTVLKMDKASGTDAFFDLLLGPVMTRTEHDMMTKLLKLKPLVFHGS